MQTNEVERVKEVVGEALAYDTPVGPKPTTVRIAVHVALRHSSRRRAASVLRSIGWSLPELIDALRETGNDKVAARLEVLQ